MPKFNLLTTNKKLLKESGYQIMGLNLAPHKVSGYNVCPHAGECAKICIGEHSGFMKMPNVRRAQIRRTKLFFQNKKLFLQQLHDDLSKFEGDKKTAVRLNVNSDLPWERIDSSLFKYGHTFYDYTKNIKRMRQYMSGQMPTNYHLTFSYSERSSMKEVGEILDGGYNVSIVYDVHYNPKKDTYLPATYNGYIVIDGDANDLRIPESDGSGVIVGLRAKMPKSKLAQFKKSGFII